MKSKLSSAMILVLLAITGLLAHQVMNKMTRTAVSAQDIAPQLAIGTTEPEPANDNEPMAVFIGDFTQGTEEGGGGAMSWTSILAAEVRKVAPLRIVVDNNGEGSGYAIRFTSPTFGEEVRRLVRSDTSVVVISGSRNDVVAEPNQVAAAARDVYHLISELAPRAELVVIGPTRGSSEPDDEILRTRDAIRAAAEAAHAQFIDPIQDDWFTNGEPGLIGSDNVHPTDLGNQRIAQQMYPVFVRLMSEHA
jgi:lysophospholipase L1-like esterase